MVLWFPGLGSGRGQCWTGGRLLLDLHLVLVESILAGAGGVVGTAVLEQPVQDLVSLGEGAVGGRALGGGSGVWGMR